MRRKEAGSNSYKRFTFDTACFIAGDDRIEYYRNQTNCFFYVRRIGENVKVGVVELAEVEEFVNKHCPEKYTDIFRPKETGNQEIRLTLTEQQRIVLNYLCAVQNISKKELLEKFIDSWLNEEVEKANQTGKNLHP